MHLNFRLRVRVCMGHNRVSCRLAAILCGAEEWATQYEDGITPRAADAYANGFALFSFDLLKAGKDRAAPNASSHAKSRCA